MLPEFGRTGSGVCKVRAGTVQIRHAGAAAPAQVPLRGMSETQRPPSSAEVARALDELEPLVETSHAIQARIQVFRERYDELGPDVPIPPASLRKIGTQGRRRYVGLQDRLRDLVRRYAWLAEPDAPGMDPTLLFQGLSVPLIAALTIYDNHLSLLTLLKDDRLRRLMTHPALGYGMAEDDIWKLVESLNAPKARRLLRQLIDAWQSAEEAAPTEDATSERLRRIVRSSTAYRFAERATLARNLPSKWSLRRMHFLDALADLGSEALGAISKAFGNGIGLVETRKGKLFGDAAVRDHLLGILEPLDLLLEKTPFRLTDTFIPGHFGHAAIWMGTDGELDALGVWARPEMQTEPLRACRGDVQAGRSVLEALRTGVELNTLAHFLNVDDVVVLRPKALTEDETRESLVRGFQQVGKEYDFNFDVETTGSIVCSELPYHVYPGVAWRTDTQLGRFTISPDDVASQALSPAGSFELLAFYHDGALVDPSEALATMTALMADG